MPGIVGFLLRAWNRGWLFGVLLVITTLAAYRPAWQGGFIWDDDAYVTNNTLLTAPDGLRRIWFSQESPSQYFPLTYTVLRIERQLWGLNPAGYHLVNILLHALNALLVWQLLRRLGVPGARLAAGIFALHPVEVEAVAWITELKSVLSLLFCLLALLAWAQFTEQRTRRVWGFYLLALFFYMLALFSKTTACTLPAALLLIVWMQRKPIDRMRAAQVVPFFLLGAGMGLLTIWWERYHQGTAGEDFGLGPLKRILIASRAVWFYAGKLVWPANLTFSYPRWTINPVDPLAYGWLVACAGLAAVICLLRRMAGRGVEVAVLFYVATLSPMLGFIMLYTFRYTFVADHYQYVASIGLVALAARQIARGLEFLGARKRFVGSVLCASLLLVLGILTWRQSDMYADVETLWRTTIARNPHSFLAYNSLGLVLKERGQVDEAILQFEKAVELKPDVFKMRYTAYNNLGNALKERGRFDEAILQFKKALELKPDEYRTYNNLGIALVERGQVDLAIPRFEKALELKPDAFEVHYNLGRALSGKDRLDEAIAHLQKALEIQPASVPAHIALGIALGRKDQVNEAIAQFQAALEIEPTSVTAHDNLGKALLVTGRMDEAIAQFQAALEIRADDFEAHYNLGNVFLRKRKFDEAIADFQKALAVEPANATVHEKLGRILMQTGRVDEALSHYQKVVALQPNNASAESNLGDVLLRKGKVNEALSHYNTALDLQPTNAHIINNLCWMLATCPQASVRNGSRAVQMGEQAERLTQSKDSWVLGTLGAAYAEAGRFPEAIAAAQQAVQLAAAQNDTAHADALRAHLKLYEAGCPVRDTGMTNSSAPQSPP